MKKAMSLVLVLIMIFSLHFPAYADGSSQETDFFTFENVEIVKQKNGKYLLDFTFTCHYPEKPGSEYPLWIDISYSLIDENNIAFQSCGIQVQNPSYGDSYKASTSLAFSLPDNAFTLDEVRAVRFVSIGVAADGVYNIENLESQPEFDLRDQVELLGGPVSRVNTDAEISSAAEAPIVKSVYDLDSLSDEDLMALPGKIAQEQIERGLVKTATINSGTYIVGEDIPAGNYTFTQKTNFATIVLVFYPGDEPYFTTTLNDTKYQINLLNNGVESGKITLEDGDSIYVTGGETEIKVYTGVVFE